MIKFCDIRSNVIAVKSVDKSIFYAFEFSLTKNRQSQRTIVTQGPLQAFGKYESPLFCLTFLTVDCISGVEARSLMCTFEPALPDSNSIKLSFASDSFLEFSSWA